MQGNLYPLVVRVESDQGLVGAGSTEVESGGSKGKDDEDTGASQPLEEMPNGSGRDHDAVHPSTSLR